MGSSAAADATCKGRVSSPRCAASPGPACRVAKGSSGAHDDRGTRTRSHQHSSREYNSLPAPHKSCTTPECSHRQRTRSAVSSRAERLSPRPSVNNMDGANAHRKSTTRGAQSHPSKTAPWHSRWSWWLTSKRQITSRSTVPDLVAVRAPRSLRKGGRCWEAVG